MKNRNRRFEELETVEGDALCFLVLVVTEATIQALVLDEALVERYSEVPWRQIRGTGNRLRHGYASLDLQCHDRL